MTDTDTDTQRIDPDSALAAYFIALGRPSPYPVQVDPRRLHDAGHAILRLRTKAAVLEHHVEKLRERLAAAAGPWGDPWRDYGGEG